MTAVTCDSSSTRVVEVDSVGRSVVDSVGATVLEDRDDDHVITGSGREMSLTLSMLTSGFMLVSMELE